MPKADLSGRGIKKNFSLKFSSRITSWIEQVNIYIFLDYILMKKMHTLRPNLVYLSFLFSIVDVLKLPEPVMKDPDSYLLLRDCGILPVRCAACLISCCILYVLMLCLVLFYLLCESCVFKVYVRFFHCCYVIMFVHVRPLAEDLTLIL